MAPRFLIDIHIALMMRTMMSGNWRLLVFGLATLAACDGEIWLDAKVLDARTGAPIEGAEIWFADIKYDHEMKEYLRGSGRLDEHPRGRSDEKGVVRVTRLIAGSGYGYHEIWLVVRKPGYLETWRRVCRGYGCTLGRTATVLLLPFD